MKNILSILILFTSLFAQGQYFGENTTYLVKTINENGPTIRTGGYLVELNSVSKTSTKESYELGSDSILILNDSILSLRLNQESGYDTVFIFSKSFGVGDSFSAKTNVNNETISIQYFIDSVKMAFDHKQLFFHTEDLEAIGYRDFVWIENVGELNHGVDYTSVFSLVDVNQQYLAYCRDDDIRSIDGSEWTVTEDQNCAFSKSLTVLSTKPTSTLKKVQLYPNPAYDVIYVRDVMAGRYKIMNVRGSTIDKGSFTNGINVQNLSAGVYFVKIYRTDGYYETHKIIIQ